MADMCDCTSTRALLMFYNILPRTREWAVYQIQEAEDLLSSNARDVRDTEGREFWQGILADAKATLEALTRASMPEDERLLRGNTTALTIYRTIKAAGPDGIERADLLRATGFTDKPVQNSVRLMESYGLVEERNVRSGGRPRVVYVASTFVQPADIVDL